MAEPRLRCYECGKTKPDVETTLISARVGGSYNRAHRRTRVRVCRDCTVAHVERVRDEIARGLTATVDTGVMGWGQAALHFGIEVSGLPRSRMGGSHFPTVIRPLIVSHPQEETV